MRKQTVFIAISVCLAACLAAAPSSSETLRRYGKTFLVGPNPSAIAAADLNEDGLPEIVTANTGQMGDPRQEKPANDELSLLKALPLTAAGPDYAAEPPLRADFAPYALAIANVDALRALDIVAVSFMAVHHHDLTLFRNVGDLVFETTYFRVPDEALGYARMLNGDGEPVFTKPGLTSVTLADVNGDGFRDAVCAAWSSDRIIILPGKADTYFGDPIYLSAEGGPRDVRCADFDGDGKLEIAATLYATGEAAIWKDDGKGEFHPVARFNTRGKLPTKLQVADVNRDGKLDLVVSHCHTEDSVVIFYGDGNFGFSTSQEIVLGTAREKLEQEIRDLVVADFTGDGRPDLAVACHASGQVLLLLNHSQDAAIPQAFAQEAYPMDGGRPRALCVADLDKNGAPDLAVACWGTNTVALLLNQTTPASATPPKKTQDKDAGKKESSKKEQPRKATGATADKKH